LRATIRQTHRLHQGHRVVQGRRCSPARGSAHTKTRSRGSSLARWPRTPPPAWRREGRPNSRSGGIAPERSSGLTPDRWPAAGLAVASSNRAHCPADHTVKRVRSGPRVTRRSAHGRLAKGIGRPGGAGLGSGKESREILLPQPRATALRATSSVGWRRIRELVGWRDSPSGKDYSFAGPAGAGHELKMGPAASHGAHYARRQRLRIA